jgi:acid phosphatase (class A)
MNTLKLACLALLLLARAAQAGHYLDEKTIPPTLLAPPPREQSAEWKQEVATIIALQKRAKPVDIAAAKTEMKLTPDLVADALGPQMLRGNYPAVFRLLDKLDDDSHAINDIAKAHWNTRRPYVAAPGVKALINAHTNPAYPSGHTSGSLVLAEVLGQLFPKKQAELRARAAEIAEHRVLAGMHYPADVEGGRQMARLILGALTQSPAFREDFQAARAEIAAKP